MLVDSGILGWNPTTPTNLVSQGVVSSICAEELCEFCAHTHLRLVRIMVAPAGDSSDSQTTRNEGWLLTGWKLKQIGQKKQKGKANHTSPTQDAPTEEWERNKRKTENEGRYLNWQGYSTQKSRPKSEFYVELGSWEWPMINRYVLHCCDGGLCMKM